MATYTPFNEEDRKRMERTEAKVDDLLLRVGSSPTYVQMWATVVGVVVVVGGAIGILG